VQPLGSSPHFMKPKVHYYSALVRINEELLERKVATPV
jgi:hypothetical protein